MEAHATRKPPSRHPRNSAVRVDRYINTAYFGDMTSNDEAARRFLDAAQKLLDRLASAR